MSDPLSVSIEPTGIMVIKIAGDLTDDRAETLRESVLSGTESVERFHKESQTKIKVLLDVSDFTGNYSARAVEMVSSFAKHNKPYIKRTAVFGASEKAHMAGEMIAAIADRENIKFFRSEAEARGWLSE